MSNDSDLAPKRSARHAPSGSRLPNWWTIGLALVLTLQLVLALDLELVPERDVPVRHVCDQWAEILEASTTKEELWRRMDGRSDVWFRKVVSCMRWGNLGGGW